MSPPCSVLTPDPQYPRVYQNACPFQVIHGRGGGWLLRSHKSWNKDKANGMCWWTGRGNEIQKVMIQGLTVSSVVLIDLQ